MVYHVDYHTPYLSNLLVSLSQEVITGFIYVLLVPGMWPGPELGPINVCSRNAWGKAILDRYLTCLIFLFLFLHYHVFTKRRLASSCGVALFFTQPCILNICWGPVPELGAGTYSWQMNSPCPGGTCIGTEPRLLPQPLARWSGASIVVIMMTMVHFSH